MSWDGSINENLGRSVRSRKGFAAVAASVVARVSADMLRAVVLDDEQVDVVVVDAAVTVLRAR